MNKFKVTLKKHANRKKMHSDRQVFRLGINNK